MKAKLFLTLTLLATIFLFEVNAQATAYANIYAEIVAPVGIEKIMDFSAGQVVTTNSNVANALSIQNTNTANSVDLSQNGNATIAAFQVTGRNNTFAITVQQQPVVLLNESSNSVTVNNFTSEMIMQSTASGAQKISINAVLNVSDNQATGNYMASAPFNVTLNYN
jgi:hypothetical protein